MSKDKNKPSNVVPLIKEKKTRDIIKKQFDMAESISRINHKMAELQQMASDQRKHFPAEAVVQTAEQGRKVEQAESSLPTDEELEREYRRKQDEMRKKREYNNRSVTNSYRLTSKRKDSGYDPK